MLFNSIAYAQGTAGAQAAGGFEGFMQNPLFLLIIMILIMYLLIFRPQQKKQKAHRLMLSELKRGDRVLTVGGISGKITQIKDDGEMALEIGPNIIINMHKSYVATVIKPNKEEPAKSKDESSPNKDEKNDSKNAESNVTIEKTEQKTGE